jgi:hypothetical protein
VTEFDRPSLDRTLPAPAGPADWEDVLSRVRARQRRHRRRLVVLTAAALVIVVGTASAIGSLRDVILERGFIGLPPVGATPSIPESGELVVAWSGMSEAIPRNYVRTWLYADGRMIWERRAWHEDPTAERPREGANELVSGYLEQRLTPEGVELVRSEVAGLFERSRALLETFPADDPWPGSRSRRALFVPEISDVSAHGAIEVADGDRLLRLHWRQFGSNAQDDAWALDHFEGAMATPEQLSALRRVDAFLTDPASVLPPSAWAVRKVRAYVPSHYEVCIGTSPPKDASQLLSLLPPRAADLLSDKSLTSSEGDLIEAREGGRTVVVGRSVTYCSKLKTEEAREVADALSGLDREPGWKGYLLGYRLAEPQPRGEPTRIWFEPYFPHGQAAFSWPSG